MCEDKKGFQDVLKKIMIDNLKRDEMQINWESDQIYRDLAIDSLEAIKIIVEIENQFHIEISNEDLRIEILDSLDKLENKIIALGGKLDDTVS